MAVLREMAIDAVEALVEVDRLEVHGLAELLRVVVGDHLSVLVEERALAVALEDRAEVPAVAVVVGELRVLELGVELRDVLQERGVAPAPANRRLLGIAVEDAPSLVVRRVLLLRGPHGGRIRLVVPHDRAVEAVHEHVGLVHVADHALRGRDRARELVPYRVPGLRFHDRRIGGGALPLVAEARVDPGMPLVAIVRVDRVAGAAARRAVIARLLARAEEPEMRVVQPRLGDVDDRNGDAAAGSRAAVALADVGTARLVELLQRPGVVGKPHLGKLRADHAPASLEHAEDVCRRDGLPRRHRRERRQDALLRHERVGDDGVHDRGAAAIGRIGFAEDVALVGQDAVVVRRAAPEHRRGRHEAALARLDDREVAGAARLARHPQVSRVDEPHELRALAVEQRIGALGRCAGRPVPRLLVARHDVRATQRREITHVRALRALGLVHARLAPVAVRAAEDHAGVLVHGVAVGRGVAARAALTLRLRLLHRLLLGRRRRRGVKRKHRGHREAQRTQRNLKASPQCIRAHRQQLAKIHHFDLLFLCVLCASLCPLCFSFSP